MSQQMSEHDELMMNLALTQAKKAIGITHPNPRVGAVIVHEDRSISVGHTQKPGSAHAEVMAINHANQLGKKTQGATLYVTLEPCNHFGRTPPCVDAIIKAQVKKVVVAIIDPNPKVAGQGLERLRAQGIEVQLLPPHSDQAKEANDLNRGFIHRMNTQRPYIRLKWATSIDGKTALLNGHSKWITGTEARSDGHLFRARADAILTGIGTILADDPMLNCRINPAHPDFIEPCLFILDTWLRTPPSAKALEASRPVYLFYADLDQHHPMYGNLQQKREVLSSQPHIHFFPTKTITSDQNNPDIVLSQLDLGHVMAIIQTLDTQEIHVEAGVTVNSSLLKNDLVDELLIYMGGKILGSGLAALSFPAFEQIESLEQPSNWSIIDSKNFSQDIRIRWVKTR